jgi:predicted Rossmann-fold nucleotide-binding protein
MKYREIESVNQLLELAGKNPVIEDAAFQNIDFTGLEESLLRVKFQECLFLGCTIPLALKAHLNSINYIFPSLDVPYELYPHELYNRFSLYRNYIPGQPETYFETPDKVIYDHFRNTGVEPSTIKESLARSLHDHSITDSVNDFISQYEERKLVGIMGGHSISRKDPAFLMVARLSQKLTEKGYLLISGGGPGAMEATHLGAWFAGRSENDLNVAIEKLGEAPTYKDPHWLDLAFLVIEEFPCLNSFYSLGIPTWLYGHEPPTPFATHIAKYFTNSIREDGLLAIAKGGIIFSPGMAGTIQEIFQEAAQNHYLNFGYSSPMIFYNSDYWTRFFPVYPLLESLHREGKYRNLILSMYDEADDIIMELENFRTTV